MFNSKKENNVMKKTYIEPSVKAIKIQLAQVIAASPITDNVTGAKFDSSESTNTMDGFDAEFSEEEEY